MATGLKVITQILSEPLTRTKVKHVSGIFKEQRDYAVACRLYFHYKIKGLRYDVAVENLNKEFYLGETTLAQIIVRQRDVIEELKNLKADRKYLQSKLPHYNWY